MLVIFVEDLAVVPVVGAFGSVVVELADPEG